MTQEVLFCMNLLAYIPPVGSRVRGIFHTPDTVVTNSDVLTPIVMR
jgi:hypothetical protein